MCTAALMGQGQSYITTPSNPQPRRDGQPVDPSSGLLITPKNVPLGSGLADAAKTAILTRREKLRIAEEGS